MTSPTSHTKAIPAKENINRLHTEIVPRLKRRPSRRGTHFTQEDSSPPSTISISSIQISIPSHSMDQFEDEFAQSRGEDDLFADDFEPATNGGTVIEEDIRTGRESAITSPEVAKPRSHNHQHSGNQSTTTSTTDRSFGAANVQISSSHVGSSSTAHVPQSQRQIGGQRGGSQVPRGRGRGGRGGPYGGGLSQSRYATKDESSTGQPQHSGSATRSAPRSTPHAAQAASSSLSESTLQSVPTSISDSTSPTSSPVGVQSISESISTTNAPVTTNTSTSAPSQPTTASASSTSSTSTTEPPTDPTTAPQPTQSTSQITQPSTPPHPEPQRIHAVRGDRSATGGPAVKKLTEAQLTAKLAQMAILDAQKSERHRLTEADQAAFQHREKEQAKERREKAIVERKDQRVQEMERAKNRERKLKAQGGREWDSEKLESDIVDGRKARTSEYVRGGHGGVIRGGGLSGSRFSGNAQGGNSNVVEQIDDFPALPVKPTESGTAGSDLVPSGKVQDWAAEMET